MPAKTIATPDTAGNVGLYTSLALDATGRPIVSYFDQTNSALKILRCGDATCTAGNSITTPDAAGNVGLYTSLALDATGNPVVSYWDATNSALKVLRCGNATCTAGNSIATPDAAGNVGRFTSLALDASGNPVVSYHDTGNGSLKVLRCGNSTCTAGNSIAAPATAGFVGLHTSLRLDGSGRPVVSYFDLTNGDLKVLRCGNATCTAGNSIATPDAAGIVGLYTSLALDPSGRPVVSYYHGNNSALKVLRCGNATCTADNSIASPDTAGNVGWDTALTLDASGKPVVSYFDLSNGDLKLLRCGNSNCTAGNSINSPDTAGIVGRFSSLALDASGNPVVSYHDTTNGALKVLHCGNPACSPGNSIATPDTAGDVGQYTSLALDTNGNPVVSYADGFNGDLQVLRCGNPTCTAGNTIAQPDPEAVGRYTSLTLDASGRPVVSYFQHVAGLLQVLHCGNTTCTAGNTLVTVDQQVCPFAAQCVGLFSSLKLDASGRPVVSYHDAFNGDLKLARCGNPTCTAGNSIAAPDTAGFVGAHTSLALDASGNPVVSYLDSSSEELKVLRCGNPACTAGNSVVTVASAPLGAGSKTSLALGAGDNPVVSYYGGANGGLKVLRCGNPTCTAGNSIGSPDQAPFVGEYSSLALDASGNPVVSYYDAANGSLKLLHCGNSTCTAGNTIATPDPGGLFGQYDVGQDTSLKLDASGNPVVSYYDVTNKDLKVLHCSTSTCLP